MNCGSGTYMRSLVHDIAISMGTYGHMTELIRTRQGIYNEKDSLLLDKESITVQHVLNKIKGEKE